MKKREILIELTSLLDVILIMIFLLLSQARAETQAAIDDAAMESAAAESLAAELERVLDERDDLEASMESERARFEEEKEALSESYAALERQMIAEGLVLENSRVLTISIGKDLSSVTFESEGGTYRIAYQWGNDTYVKNRLKALVHEELREISGESVFIVFLYDRTKIYESAYELIVETIREIKLEASESPKEIPLNIIEMDLYNR